MATTANWTATLVLSGDDTATKVHTAAANSASPAYDMFVNLSSGANTFAVPGAGTTRRITILPPSGNTVLITIKGITGDTGIPIHKTDPTSVALDTTFASIVLNAANTINNVRIIWS